MTTVMPLAKIGKLFNRPRYVDNAKRQFLLHIQGLFDSATGLCFHGWIFDESTPGSVGHNSARARWAKGNSWLTIAIPGFIELLELPETDLIRLYLISVLDAQCKSLEVLQDRNRPWRTSLDVSEEEGSYHESSATTGYAYGILKAVRKRCIAKRYESMGRRAVNAVVDKINDEGELLDTSFGTGMGSSLQHYLDIERTSMSYGQAMPKMALVEFLRVSI